tara:strand:- start:152 stop:760 length:609 start_codon:yes stop_codon:yes gene_type:complete
MEKETIYQRLKTTFVYGLFVIIPIALTIWIVLSLIQLISGPVSSLFGQSISDMTSFILSILFITGIGFLARNFLGQTLISIFESIIERIPLVRLIYKSIKQVADSLSFKKKALACVLVEYPRKGTYALGWITNEHPLPLKSKNGQNVVEDMISVFVPTTPNPTSGYFLYLKREECQELDISIEESIKLLMSAGVLDKDSFDV